MWPFTSSKSIAPKSPVTLDRTIHIDPNTPFNPLHLETAGDGDIAREAIEVCRIFAGRTRNRPDFEALRKTWRDREPDYLLARFGAALGWQDRSEAERFYRKHR